MLDDCYIRYAQQLGEFAWHYPPEYHWSRLAMNVGILGAWPYWNKAWDQEGDI